MDKELVGKVALVTGGTKGIGRAIAERLSEAVAIVIITARTRPTETQKKHHFIAADLIGAGETEKVVSEINEKFGSIIFWTIMWVQTNRLNSSLYLDCHFEDDVLNIFPYFNTIV